MQTSKILFAAVIAGLASTSASAADLPSNIYTKAPVAAPIKSWDGFYVGGNVGYGWNGGKTEISPSIGVDVASTTLDNKSKGVIGGAQIGYNWQIGKFVTGFEADIQGTGVKGATTEGPVPFIHGGVLDADSDRRTEQKLSWFGTVRGRLGVTATPELLFYATGGFAYGKVDDAANLRFGPAPFFGGNPFEYPASASKTKAGWIAGAGTEWAFARNWSAKVEYLYLDLGSVTAIGLQIPRSPFFMVAYDWKLKENIVRLGLNYHF